jgi:heme-degrading monooxygenase HmoA
MLARVWRGVTPAEKADEYADYLRATGIPDYRAVEGNRGVYLLRRVTQTEAEFVLVTLWDSLDAIRHFAGPDIERAVYYPEDSTYLLELEPTVTHYEVLEP